jgi:DNA-binding MarR family transcriptional regulator
MIRQILDYLERYEKDVGNSDLKEFSIYMKDQVLGSMDQKSGNSFIKEDYGNYLSYPEIEFSTLLTGLYRFARHYTKKAFSGTAIKTIDEFGFLATLLRKKSLLKNELINEHLLEISSGSEILKRLIRNELVQEYPDEKDKRAKRVALTKKGAEAIMNAFDDMHKVSEIVIGNLNTEELGQALAIFNKLNFFHLHIHAQDRNTKLQELHNSYVVNQKDISKN